MYWLAPTILAFGAKPFAVWLGAASAAILTRALAYRLGRELPGRRRANAVLALGRAALALPTAGYVAIHRAEVLARPAAVSGLSSGSLLDSGRQSFDAFFRQGDVNGGLNLPGWRILDAPTGQ